MVPEAGCSHDPGGKRGGRLRRCPRWCTQSWDPRYHHHHRPHSVKQSLDIISRCHHSTHVILSEGAQGGDLDGPGEHGAGALL